MNLKANPDIKYTLSPHLPWGFGWRLRMGMSYYPSDDGIFKALMENATYELSKGLCPYAWLYNNGYVNPGLHFDFSRINAQLATRLRSVAHEKNELPLSNIHRKVLSGWAGKLSPYLLDEAKTWREVLTRLMDRDGFTKACGFEFTYIDWYYEQASVEAAKTKPESPNKIKPLPGVHGNYAAFAPTYYTIEHPLADLPAGTTVRFTASIPNAGLNLDDIFPEEPNTND